MLLQTVGKQRFLNRILNRRKKSRFKFIINRNMKLITEKEFIEFYFSDYNNYSDFNN